VIAIVDNAVSYPCAKLGDDRSVMKWKSLSTFTSRTSTRTTLVALADPFAGPKIFFPKLGDVRAPSAPVSYAYMPASVPALTG